MVTPGRKATRNFRFWVASIKLAAVKEKIETVRAKAAAKGRSLNYGIRLHVIVRETNEEAWQAANALIQYVDDATIAAAQAKFKAMDSVGQRRMAELHNGDRSKLEVSQIFGQA